MSDTKKLPRIEPPTPVLTTPSVVAPQTLPIVILSLATLILVAITFVYAFNLGKNNNVNVVPTPSSITPTSVPNSPEASTPTVSAALGEFGTLTYLSPPEKIPNPNILNPTTSPDYGGYSFGSVGAYRVGKFSSGAELLIVPIVPEGPSTPYYYRIIRQQGKYYLVESLINDAYIKKNLSEVFKTSLVKTISYPLKELLPPNYLPVDGKEYYQLVSSFGASQFVTQLKDKVKLSTTEYGDIISVYEAISDLNDVFQRVIYLQLRDSTLLTYRLNTSLSFTDDKVPHFNFSNGQANTSQYNSAIATKCGGNQYQTVIKGSSSLLSGKVPVGRTGSSTQDDVFQLKDASNKLVVYLYNQYNSSLYSGGPTPLVSNIDQFVVTDNHFIYQDKLGDWQAFTNNKFALQAECGKPVIYLYPPKDTSVSVKVGAVITKSEPLYPINGWSVVAHPNGQIEYQGGMYPNLFWEGTGAGLYKNIGNYGFVVPQSKLVSTLYSQLSLLGLNTQESADFMEFWKSRLPTSPYVRLSWLNTEDMNQLAPLQVSPMPKTVIRIFLDFQGLDKPITLIPQILSAPKREGFTLVEWGGLLRHN